MIVFFRPTLDAVRALSSSSSLPGGVSVRQVRRMVKAGGRAEKQVERWISEGNSLCLHGNARCPVHALFLRAVKKLPPV